MFVFSFKAATVKILGAVVACVAVAILAVGLMPDAGYALNVNKIVTPKDVSLKGIDSEKKQVELLLKLGVEVKPNPVQSGNVSVPKKFDAVLLQYNELQKKQGFDLKKFRGKTVSRYTYEITDLDESLRVGEDSCYATLILYKNKVVGADICCPKTADYGVLIQPS